MWEPYLYISLALALWVGVNIYLFTRRNNTKPRRGRPIGDFMQHASVSRVYIQRKHPLAELNHTDKKRGKPL